MQLILRDIAGNDPALPHVQGALTEMADECRHSSMFARTAQTSGAPSDPRRGGAAHALRPRDIARRTPSLSGWQLRNRTAVAACVAIVAENLVQPSVSASVGPDPRQARAAARADEHHRSKLRDASAGLVAFLREVAPSAVRRNGSGAAPA